MEADDADASGPTEVLDAEVLGGCEWGVTDEEMDGFGIGKGAKLSWEVDDEGAKCTKGLCVESVEKDDSSAVVEASKCA